MNISNGYFLKYDEPGFYAMRNHDTIKLAYHPQFLKFTVNLQSNLNLSDI